MVSINIKVDEGNIRIDQFLVNKYPKLSRSKIQSLIKNKHIIETDIILNLEKYNISQNDLIIF